jgi:hypothetical protein
LEQITAPFIGRTLDNFDWLVIDGRALLALKKQSINALQAAVNRGLGVYIIADNELVSAWPVTSMDWLSDIHIQPLDVANYASTPIWPHSQIEQTMPLLKAKITAVNHTPLVQNNAAQILVSQSKIGFGKVALSLINSTYSWQTSGMTGEYSYYWQSIIYELARPKQMPYWLNTQNDSLSLLNQQQKRCLLGVSDSGVVTQNQDTQTLVLTQDMLQTERNCLTIWPIKNAWQKLTWGEYKQSVDEKRGEKSSTDTWFYTYSEQDWSQWQQAQKHRASQNMAQQHNTKLLEKQATKSLDKIWFWGLLVLSMSMLWLERKLF